MRFWGGIFLAGAALFVILGAQGWPGVIAGNLNDPDSYMRLERILQGIAQGHLVNSVARDDSGAGVLVEWSRLLDALLWAMAAPLAPFLGWRQALFISGVAVGPLGAGCLAVALAFAASPFSARRFLWLVPLAATLLPGLRTFEVPGVVHYHILLLALIAAAFGFTARSWRGDAGYGFFAGLCGGFAIWMTPETMPFVLMAYAGLLLRWWQADIGAAIAACAAGFFDVLGFALAIDPPAGGYGAPEIDRLSVVYVILGLLLLIGGLALWRMERWRDKKRARITGIGLMAVLLVLWIALFPKVAMGPYGIMSPADMQRFFGVMTELQPLRSLSEIVQYILPGALAVLYMGYKFLTARDVNARILWGYAALCGFVVLWLGQYFILFVEFPAGLAAVLLPVALTDFSAALAEQPLGAMLTRVAVIFLTLLAPAIPAFAASPTKQAGGKAYPSCSLRYIGAMLAPYAGKIVLAPADDTPELLYRSDIITVGSLYQHGVPGYLRARDAWRSDGGAAAPGLAIKAAKAEFILICPQAERYRLVVDLPPTTLWDELAQNRPPAWLRLQTVDAGAGWRLYQIIP